MIDIGVNFNNIQFEHDLESVIKNAISNGVACILLTSTNYQSYLKNLGLIEQYQHLINFKTTFGTHPHNANSDNESFLHIEELNNSNVVAIGEFGLDYFRQISDIKTQRKVMEKYLTIAHDYPHLPLFLHERNAFEDFISILKNGKNSNKKVVHCFTGTKEEAKSYLDLNCFIGITGWLTDTRRNSSLIEAIQYIPIEKIMIETDSPYLTPKMKKRPIRNEPKYLNLILEAVALHKGLSIEEAKSIIYNNTVNFFNLELF